MSNDIQELRQHLFATLTDLRDRENPLDIDRAKAVCEVSNVIVSVAKAEIDFARVNGSVDTQFFHKPTAPGNLLGNSINDNNKNDSLNGSITVEGAVTTHKLM